MSIIKLAKVALLYYQGLQNSTQFDVDTTKERIDYLNTLKQKQNARSQQWISEYINKVFHWQIQALTARHIGFLHVRDEYNQALRHYLKSQSTTLLQDAEHVQDIDTYLAHSLRSHVNGFNRKNFINYQQLEAIRASFAEFEVYFSKAQKELDEGAAFFENNITLLKKIQTIDALKKLACNNQVPIDIRLESIKNKLSKRSVQMTLLAHQHYASFTFNWLQECVLSLLSILGLYVPKDKALLERLNQATENKGLMLRDIGLFSLKSSRHYDLPKPIFSVT